MNKNIENVLVTLDSFRTNDEMTYSAYSILHDEISLLDDLFKEQEPVLLENQHKPFGYNTNANSPWISRCPKCKKKIEGKQTHYCKYCGQAVKWDE